MEKEKTIISKSVRNGNIAAAIIGAIYILIIIWDMIEYSITIETVHLILGTIIIMGIVWAVIFFISFIMFAIAKGLEN